MFFFKKNIVLPQNHFSFSIAAVAQNNSAKSSRSGRRSKSGRSSKRSDRVKKDSSNDGDKNKEK